MNFKIRLRQDILLIDLRLRWPSLPFYVLQGSKFNIWDKEELTELLLILKGKNIFTLNNPSDTKFFPINTSPLEVTTLLDSKTILKPNWIGREPLNKFLLMAETYYTFWRVKSFFWTKVQVNCFTPKNFDSCPVTHGYTSSTWSLIWRKTRPIRTNINVGSSI